MSKPPDILVTTYLEMTTQAQFQPAFLDDSTVVNDCADGRGQMWPYYQFLYGSVGKEWRWRDRLLMSDDDLREILSAPGSDHRRAVCGWCARGLCGIIA